MLDKKTGFPMAYDLTEEQRDRYRETSTRSQLRKQSFLREHEQRPFQPTFDEAARLDPNDLMPLVEPNGLTCLSLFSGGGGLDLGFERAGFSHLASMEILDMIANAFGVLFGWGLARTRLGETLVGFERLICRQESRLSERDSASGKI